METKYAIFTSDEEQHVIIERYADNNCVCIGQSNHFSVMYTGALPDSISEENVLHSDLDMDNYLALELQLYIDLNPLEEGE